MCPAVATVRPFGDDAAKHAERAPLQGLAKSTVPLLAFSAELDPLYFHLQADSLKTVLCRAGRCPQMGQLPRHSHMSEVYAFNTPDKSLSDQVLAFVRGR